MLKILSTSQVRAADQATINNEPIASIDLMERASRACADWIIQHFAVDTRFIVFAGTGNNGGDALAISRMLIAAGFNTDIYCVKFSESLSTDAQTNLERLEQLKVDVGIISDEGDFPSIYTDAVIIEGIFGSGLTRPPEGIASTVIKRLNAMTNDVISIDIPSGLFADSPTTDLESAVHATHTLSLQLPKLSFMLPGTGEHCGTLHILPIGLDEGFIESQESNYRFVDSIEEFSSDFIRGPFDHKGSFGYALLLAGSYGMMGAAVLASRSALRAGVGKISTHVPKNGVDVLQSSVPEAMCSIDIALEHLSNYPKLDQFNVIAVGPGIGKHEQTADMLSRLMKEWNKPMIIDADALNIISKHPKMIKDIPNNSILTPHIGEFQRLFGSSKNEFERLDLLSQKAIELGVYIVLKGRHSAIATPQGKIFFNSTGNPGMATAGSGDVLTGTILGLLAQCGDPLIASVCAVYLHGLGGDEAAELVGQHGLIASDIAESIPFAMKTAFNLDE